jgi:hypothetical protein
MNSDSATAVRDQAARRVRRLTATAIAGATALTAAFAGLAAGSTHSNKTTKQPAATPTAPARKTVTAPVPTLTPSGSSATPQTQAPQQQTQTQTPVVTPSAQPPVAVTGGS